MTAYLLHSDTPLGTRGGHEARHYLGWTTEDPAAVLHRVYEHRFGNAQAKIVEAFGKERPNLDLVMLWPEATKAQERRLKRSGHFERHCWRCQQAEALRLYFVLEERGAWLQR